MTYQASDDLRAAKEAVEATKTAYDDAVAHLHEVIAAEVAKPNRPADIARFMGWHSGYVRRIAKAHGVPPHIDVEPPRRRKADD